MIESALLGSGFGGDGIKLFGRCAVTLGAGRTRVWFAVGAAVAGALVLEPHQSGHQDHGCSDQWARVHVLITGCHWCDLPRGSPWASQSAAHRWLQRWHTDGTLAALQARILGIAEGHGIIQWQYGA